MNPSIKFNSQPRIKWFVYFSTLFPLWIHRIRMPFSIELLRQIERKSSCFCVCVDTWLVIVGQKQCLFGFIHSKQVTFQNCWIIFELLVDDTLLQQVVTVREWYCSLNLYNRVVNRLYASSVSESSLNLYAQVNNISTGEITMLTRKRPYFELVPPHYIGTAPHRNSCPHMRRHHNTRTKPFHYISVNYWEQGTIDAIHLIA